MRQLILVLAFLFLLDASFQVVAFGCWSDGEACHDKGCHLASKNSQILLSKILLLILIEGGSCFAKPKTKGQICICSYFDKKPIYDDFPQKIQQN